MLGAVYTPKIQLHKSLQFTCKIFSLCDNKIMKRLILIFGLIFMTVTIFSNEKSTVPQGAFPVLPSDFTSKEDKLISASYLNEQITQNSRITVSPDGHLQANGERIRIFGTNLSQFPSKKEAEYYADQLANQGYNCVRFHHTDAEWSNCFVKRLRNGKHVLDKDKLDDFDYFFAKLKEKGIYSNINFLTGRNMSAADGYKPEIDKISDWKAKHCLGFWNEQAQQHQKDYILELLNHENPYTKTKYKDDPAVAFVEINNENGLIMGYLSNSLSDYYGGEYWKELEDKWNVWLNQNNYNYEKLAQQFNLSAPLQQNLIQNNDKWNLEQHEGGKALYQNTNGTIKIKIQNNGKESWHIQLNKPNLSLKKDTIYTLKFSAKANKDAKISVDLMQAHSPWQNSGFSASVELTQKYQDYEFILMPNETDDNLRINFGNMGFLSGNEVNIKDISFYEGGNLINVEHPKYDKEKVKLPAFEQYKTVPEKYKNIILSFLYDMEEKYWLTMRDFIRGEAGSKSLIMGTINGCSTPVIQNCFDVIDSHAYWNHPVFPGSDWNVSDYYVNNTSLTKADSNNTLINLAKQRIYGKPFSVTEYDHPYPNQYSAEMYPMFAAFASFQDWDCIYTFCYELSENTDKSNKINGYFDQRNDPAKVNAAPFAAKIFRKGLIKPAEKNYYITLDRQKEKSLLYKNSAWNIGNPELYGSIPYAALSHKIGIIVKQNNFETDSSFINLETANKADFSQQKLFSDTNELYWDKQSGVFIACTEDVTITVSHENSQLPEIPESWRKQNRILPLQGNSDFSSVIALKEKDNILIFNCSWRGNDNENLRVYNSNKFYSICRENAALTTDGSKGNAPVYAIACDGFMQLYNGKKIILTKDAKSVWMVVPRKEVEAL